MTAGNPTSQTTRRRFLKTATALSVLGAAGGSSRHLCSASAAADAVASPLSPPNETIQKAREAALDVLKPSQKDLEHGFELHANSLVFESYGFAPRAAPDGDLIRKAMEEGASEAELNDLREELPMIRTATDAGERKEFLEAFRAAGVTCIFQNAGEESNDPLRLIKRLARFTFATDLLRNELFKAASPDDIVAAKKQNRLCLYFTANGVPLRQQWNSVRDELGFIRVFQQLGIRMMHVTYNRRNPLGDGCGEATDGGLSDFGRAAIARDEPRRRDRGRGPFRLAHEPGSGQGIAAADGRQPHDRGGAAPSHPLQARRSHPRHLRHRRAGGHLLHLGFPRRRGPHRHVPRPHRLCGQEVRRRPRRHRHRHRLRIAQRGRRAARKSRSAPEARAACRAGKRSGPKAPLGGRADPSLAWTNWPLFTVGLVQRGYADDAIQKILGGNVLRVARGVGETGVTARTTSDRLPSCQQK